MLRRFENFDVQLAFRRADFISPPRDAQRRWLVGRTLDELARELDHLEQTVAPAMVRGRDTTEVHDGMAADLSDEQIMEDWQLPLMQAMADDATAAGGSVLEIGFGRGVASTMLQKGGCTSHTIIECNEDIVNTRYAAWRKALPADKDLRLVVGRWEDVIDGLGRFDAIFFHTYAMNEEEFLERALKSVTFAEHFFGVAAQHLVPGGVFTYLTHEIDSLSRPHQRLLFEHFRRFELRMVEGLEIPEDVLDAWWSPSMVAVRAFA